MWVKNKDWLNGKSYLTLQEIEESYKEVMIKIADVLFLEDYFIDTKRFVRNVLEFAVDNEYLTWRQYEAILKIKTTKERIRLYGKNSKNKETNFYFYSKKDFSDKELDDMKIEIFGNCFYGQELEGMQRYYREDGSRYFAFPTDPEFLI